jgi:hypothetical protein
VASPKGKIQRQRDRQKRSQTKARITSLEVMRKVPAPDELASREAADLNSRMILRESRGDVPAPGSVYADPGPAAKEIQTISAVVADVSSREPLADVLSACSARGPYD